MSETLRTSIDFDAFSRSLETFTIDCYHLVHLFSLGTDQGREPTPWHKKFGYCLSRSTPIAIGQTRNRRSTARTIIASATRRGGWWRIGGCEHYGDALQLTALFHLQKCRRSHLGTAGIVMHMRSSTFQTPLFRNWRCQGLNMEVNKSMTVVRVEQFIMS